MLLSVDLQSKMFRPKPETLLPQFTRILAALMGVLVAMLCVRFPAVDAKYCSLFPLMLVMRGKTLARNSFQSVSRKLQNPGVSVDMPVLPDF